MSFILSIETSSSDYFMALGDAGDVIYHSADIEGLNKNKDLGLLLRTGLKQTKRSVQEIDFISINVGPGGLGAVRSGVSFANGLSYGLNKPLLPLNAFELVGFEVSKKNALSVIMTSNAADGNAYGGLYSNGHLQKSLYGPLADIVTELSQGLDECQLAGTHQDKIPEIIPNIACVKSDARFASAIAQIELAASQNVDGRLTNEPVGALNELSDMFQVERDGV